MLINRVDGFLNQKATADLGQQYSQIQRIQVVQGEGEESMMLPKVDSRAYLADLENSQSLDEDDIEYLYSQIAKKKPTKDS